MSSLFVNEVFLSLQGEGHFTGTPAVFVRLQGCDVHCPWCDTGYAMSLDAHMRRPDNDPDIIGGASGEGSYARMDTDFLCERITALAGPVRHVVLTGGEPFLQNVQPFMNTLQAQGWFIQAETSGTRPLPAPCPGKQWITLSPKRARMPLEENWALADEIKLPIAGREDADLLLPLVLEKAARAPRRPVIALQPVSQDKAATALCIRLCLEHNLHLSLQTHKYLDLR